MWAKLFIKIFLVTGIPFGLVFGLLSAGVGAVCGMLSPAVSPAMGAAYGFLFGGMFTGACFGLAMAVTFVLLQHSTTSSPEVRHRSTLVVPGSTEDAHRMCVAAIQTVPKISMDEKACTPFKIAATKGPTWRSWRDCISCGITPMDNDRQRIIVESRPWWRTTLVDFGSNIENVEAIVTHLVSCGGTVVER